MIGAMVTIGFLGFIAESRLQASDYLSVQFRLHPNATSSVVVIPFWFCTWSSYCCVHILLEQVLGQSLFIIRSESGFGWPACVSWWCLVHINWLPEHFHCTSQLTDQHQHQHQHQQQQQQQQQQHEEVYINEQPVGLQDIEPTMAPPFQGWNVS